MTDYGVTSAGFVPKPLSVIKSEVEESLKGIFGAQINLEPRSRFGQLVGILADREALIWELGQAVYKASYPDSAEGASLDEVAGITGTLRLPATYGTVNQVLKGVNGTTVPAGTVFSVAPTSTTRFATLADATIATLGNRVASHAYAVGDLITQDGNLYACVAAGTSSGSSLSPGDWTSQTSLDYTDGTVHWRYLGAGTAAVLAACQAEATGELVAPAGTLTTIETPVAGLASVTNPLDAAPGRPIETDAALRVRREAELRAEGNGAVDAIRARVDKVDGVTSCTVFENPTDATDGDGLPPHSIEVLALGGDSQAILEAVWASKAGGIATYGSTSGTVEDGAGVAHTVKFSRPTEEPVYITVAVTTDGDFPADGAAQIKAALVSYALGELLDAAGAPIYRGYLPGDDVVTSKLYVPIETVSGIVDVTSIHIGLAPSPGSSANIAITLRQLATFDTSRITVTVT